MNASKWGIVGGLSGIIVAIGIGLIFNITSTIAAVLLGSAGGYGGSWIGYRLGGGL